MKRSPLPQHLDDDVLPCPDKVTNGGNFIRIHIELGGLDVAQRNRQEPDGWKFLHDVAHFVVKNGNMRCVEAKFFDYLGICPHFPAPYRCFPLGDNFHLIGLSIRQEAAVLIQNSLGKTLVLIGIDSFNLHIA